MERPTSPHPSPKEGLPNRVFQIVLVRKLREVRAQVGFTRIEPVTPDLQDGFDLGVQAHRSRGPG